MLTWTDSEAKLQRLSGTSDSYILAQLKQDYQTGYHLFNAKLARYYSRKQQFADIVAGQSIYQVPLDSVRVLVMTAYVTSTLEVPLKRVDDEEKWRQITSVRTVSSNFISHYFPLGNDQVMVWPIPTGNVTKGFRFVYQPQDHDLTIEDITSTSSGATVSVSNTGVTVTATSSVFSADLASLMFQRTGVADNSFYEIVSATATTLTLKTPYVATTATGCNFRIGQVPIIPQEYQDAPIHYALGLYFSANGNETRGQFHLGDEKNPGMFYKQIEGCLADYSSSNENSVYTEEDDYFLNAFLIPPVAQ